MKNILWIGCLGVFALGICGIIFVIFRLFTIDAASGSPQLQATATPIPTAQVVEAQSENFGGFTLPSLNIGIGLPESMDYRVAIFIGVILLICSPFIVLILRTLTAGFVWELFLGGLIALFSTGLLYSQAMTGGWLFFWLGLGGSLIPGIAALLSINGSSIVHNGEAKDGTRLEAINIGGVAIGFFNFLIWVFTGKTVGKQIRGQPWIGSMRPVWAVAAQNKKAFEFGLRMIYFGGGAAWLITQIFYR